MRNTLAIIVLILCCGSANAGYPIYYPYNNWSPRFRVPVNPPNYRTGYMYNRAWQRNWPSNRVTGQMHRSARPSQWTPNVMPGPGDKMENQAPPVTWKPNILP